MSKRFEQTGRVCYKSENKIAEDSCASFLKRISDSEHESVIERKKVGAQVICRCGASHEIVRRRLSFAARPRMREAGRFILTEFLGGIPRLLNEFQPMLEQIP